MKKHKVVGKGLDDPKPNDIGQITQSHQKIDRLQKKIFEGVEFIEKNIFDVPTAGPITIPNENWLEYGVHGNPFSWLKDCMPVSPLPTIRLTNVINGATKNLGLDSFHKFMGDPVGLTRVINIKPNTEKFIFDWAEQCSPLQLNNELFNESPIQSCNEFFQAGLGGSINFNIYTPQPFTNLGVTLNDSTNFGSFKSEFCGHENGETVVSDIQVFFEQAFENFLSFYEERMYNLQIAVLEFVNKYVKIVVNYIKKVLIRVVNSTRTGLYQIEPIVRSQFHYMDNMFTIEKGVELLESNSLNLTFLSYEQYNNFNYQSKRA